MNPYTYQNRAKGSQEASGVLGFVKAVVNAPINSVLAIAFILFAAGSVVSVLGVTQAELNNSDYVSFHEVRHVVALHKSDQAVLGDSIVISQPIVFPDAAPLAQTFMVTSQPLDFDHEAGLWNYQIDYITPDINKGLGGGSISIGKTLVADNINSIDTIKTGYMLKPGTTYEITFWSKNGKKGVKVGVALLTTKVIEAIQAQ